MSGEDYRDSQYVAMYCTVYICVSCRVCCDLMNELFQMTEVPDVWQHDMFEDDRPPRRSRPFAAQKSAKLVITNLDYGVNDQDIQV